MSRLAVTLLMAALLGVGWEYLPGWLAWANVAALALMLYAWARSSES